MPEPLVSVNMAVYNSRSHIGPAIESVLAQQTDFPFEVVIGDDCSSDGTREIVTDYARRYPAVIQLLLSETNLGARKNYDRNVAASRGRYIAYCDGDDLWQRPDKLQRQADFLESHPGHGLVCTDYDVCHVATGRRIGDYVRHRRWQVPSSRRVEDYIKAHCAGTMGSAILTSTVMARRDLIAQVTAADPYLYGGYFRMGDTQRWIEINALSDVAFIPESLATYNIFPESMSQSRDYKKALRFQISKTEMYLYLGQKYNVAPDVLKPMETYLQQCRLRLAFEERDAAAADAVKTQKGLDGVKETLLFLGAKNRLVHAALGGAMRLKRRSRKTDAWT